MAGQKRNDEASKDLAYVRRAERQIAKGRLKMSSEKELRKALRG
jgi:hypothetical protein